MPDELDPEAEPELEPELEPEPEPEPEGVPEAEPEPEPEGVPEAEPEVEFEPLPSELLVETELLPPPEVDAPLPPSLQAVRTPATVIATNTSATF